MTRHPSNRPTFRERADLVHQNDDSETLKGGYSFVNRQRANRTTARRFTDARPTIDDIEHPPVIITEDTPPLDEELNMPRRTVEYFPRPPSVTIDLPCQTRHQPDLCSCAAMQKALQSCIDITIDAEYVIPRLVMNEGVMIRGMFESSALAAPDSWERLAYRHCPFDGHVIDPTLQWTPHLDLEDPPLCCGWMAMMVGGERVRLPRPDATLLNAYLIGEEGREAPFFCCGRCGTELCELVHRRRTWFQTR